MHSLLVWHSKGYFQPLQKILKGIDFENLFFTKPHTHTHNDCSRNWVLVLVRMEILGEEEGFQFGYLCLHYPRNKIKEVKGRHYSSCYQFGVLYSQVPVTVANAKGFETESKINTAFLIDILNFWFILIAFSSAYK